MFCGILADTLLCPLPSPPLLHAIDILDSFLGIWHLKNLFWLGGMWKDWSWVFQQQLWDILMTQGRCKGDRTLWMQIHTSWWHYWAAQHCHTCRRKSPPSVEVRAPVPGGHLGGVPVAWTVNTLVHGKGLTYWMHLLTSPSLWVSPRKRRWRENHWWGCFPTCCEEGDGEAGMGSPGGYTWASRSQFSCPATQPTCSRTVVRFVPTLV